MKKTFCLIAFFAFTFSYIFGQGTIRGKISDENGESLIGVTVVLKSDRSIGTVTDFDGNFSIKLAQTTPQVLIFSYVGYTSVEENVNPLKGEVIIKDLVLLPSTTNLIEVEIVAKQEKDRGYYMESIKKKAATTIDYVSSQSMKLTGDNNAGSAIARVTGVSTNGSFITVRGIGDRYVKTSVNGAQIPTLDPFTNNIKLDLIPASLIDNIIITKTASPELSSAWTGAYISVETKDFPDNFSLNLETQVGYNEQTSFKDILANQSSSTDWLGYDHNFRDRDHTSFVGVNPSPNQYQEFVALGLGDYFKSLGVNQNWGSGTVGENYFKLGLVELGLLPKAQFNDPQAFENAKNLYVSEGFKDKAFTTINEAAGKVGRSFPNNWNTFYKRAPLNFSQSFSIGNQMKLFGKDFGYYGGFRYGSSILYDPNAVSNRTILSDVDSLGAPLLDEVVDLQNVKYTNGWSGLLNLAFKLNTNHSVAFLLMPNYIGVNSIKDGLGYGSIIYKYSISKSQFYEQRKQLIYQLKSEHYFPEIKFKLDLNASYCKGNSSAPDFKNLEFFANDDFVYTYDKAMSYMSRDYRYLTEDIFDSRLIMEFPLSNKPGILRKIKFGGAYQNVNKKYDQINYGVNFNQVSPYVTNNDLNAYFAPERFDIGISNIGGRPQKSVDFYYGRTDGFSNHTFGKSDILAAFVTVDYSISPAIRVSGGLRMEYTDLYTDVIEYDRLKLASNDQRRGTVGESFIVNPGILNSTNYLPSINLIYKLNQDEIAPINLRLNYSKSIARPSLREYSETIVFDYELNAYVFGNAQLKMVQIDNYDLRFESFFKSGDNITFSLFYKNFKNHIELINFANVGFTWTNANQSKVFGLEVEGKKKIFKNLEFRANVSIVNSSTEIVLNLLNTANGVRTWFPVDTVTRNMFGQAPYVFNGVLSYAFDKIGLVSTLSYNLQGPRIVLTSFGNAPDVYEMGRHLLDFKTSKSIGKYFAVSLTIRDLLNSPIRRAYKYEQGYIADFDRYKYGTNYIFGVSYKL